jgi:hypothetical protein
MPQETFVVLLKAGDVVVRGSLALRCDDGVDRGEMNYAT